MPGYLFAKMPDERFHDWKPICVASTSPSSNLQSSKSSPTRVSSRDQQGKPSPSESKETTDLNINYFKGAEWTPDGTTLLTDSADHHIRTFILPPDLLEKEPVHQLSPYSTLASAEPTYATAVYPFYALQDPSTTLFLSSTREHPIRLSSALAPTTLATYSLIHPTTEAYLAPHSIIYPAALGGTHFLTGSDSLICLFDVSRPGREGPVSRLPTIPSKRKQIVGGGVGMKGIVSAMAVNPAGDGLLAAGTFSRHVGLYTSNGSGELIGTFSVANTEANREIGGRGVTQLLWSPCGRYLYIAERKSDGVLVYDIRVTGQMLGYLRGRKARTNQRMKVDVIPAGGDGSHEVWAGGTDGFMRMWRDPVHAAGGQEPDWEWKVHEDAVSSTVFHPMGSVVATCSGQRHQTEDASIDQGDQISDGGGPDNSLKVWSMPFLASTDVDHEDIGLIDSKHDGQQ